MIRSKPVPKPVNVIVDILPRPVTPAQKAAWHKFWKKIIAEVKADDSR